MCPHTTVVCTAICVCSHLYLCVRILLYACLCVRILLLSVLLYVCPHTCIYVSAYYCMRVLIHLERVRILLYACVSAYYCVCVRILLYACPHTFGTRPHTTVCVCVRILLRMCPHTTVCVSSYLWNAAASAPRATISVTSATSAWGRRYSLYLLCWYKSTNTDERVGGAGRGAAQHVGDSVCVGVRGQGGAQFYYSVYLIY
jgi:hypothetical protein